MQIDLNGWTHVQTWRESHGMMTQTTYQREPQVNVWQTRQVECLVVTEWRDGRPSNVRIETKHDYLMARDIRANPTRFIPAAERGVEPCCTAGWEDFYDTQTEDMWRVYGAAGHGEWAFKIKSED